jgi:hypothetical protein
MPDAKHPALGVGTRWAVVVGMSKYQFEGVAGLSGLPFATDDANMFYK